MYKSFKGTPINTLGFMSVSLLYCNHRNVSDTHAAIVRVIRTRTQAQLQCVKITSHLKIPVLITVKMATLVVETCG
jgi:hypothetical protein